MGFCGDAMVARMDSARTISVIGRKSMLGLRIKECLPGVRWEYLTCDVTDADSVSRAISSTKASTVLNCAAFTDLDAAWKQDGDRDGACYQVNALGAGNVAAACAANDKKLVHLSTEYVFNGEQDRPYTEEDPADAVDWYGITKAMGEALCLQSAPGALVIRLATPFQSASPTKLDIARKILARLQSGRSATMFTDTVITPTWTDDIARGIDALLRKGSSGLYHVVGSTPLSPHDFAIAVADEFGLSRSLVIPTTLGDHLAKDARPYAKRLDISHDKLRRETGLTTSTCTEALRAVHSQMLETESVSP